MFIMAAASEIKLKVRKNSASGIRSLFMLCPAHKKTAVGSGVSELIVS